VNTGRYAGCTPLTRRERSGRNINYLAIRILPLGETVAGATDTQVRATEIDRLDLIAARTLGDPLQAWQIADANDAIDPFDLCRSAGAVLKLPASTL
jgi:hypothetical protein